MKGINLQFISSVEHIGFTVHASPLAYRQCQLVYTGFLTAFTALQTYTIWDIFVLLSLNLLFNFADILNEFSVAMKALDNHDYSQFGIMIGKITSDVFVKNPYF